MSDLFIQNQKNRDRMEKIAFPGPRTTGEAIKIKQPIDRSFSSISDKEEGIELRESVDESSSK